MFRARAAAGFPLELGLLCRLPRSYRYLSTAATPSPSSSSSFLDFDQLPCFPVRGKDLKVLYEPQDFYSTLLKGIKKAKKRIFLASLYIGKEETELVRALPLWQGIQDTK
jgi:phosphatidylserine/phosphatidylglycerophosphate/cardiolipin synthase-like enzyme